MNFFPKINRWQLPEAALGRSVAEMAIDGRSRREGTCFWLGRRAGGAADISHLVFLRGSGIRKGSLNIQISAELMREVHERAEALRLILLGQIHSHSIRCGVDMSASDHAYGVSVPFFLSIICPDFAQDPMTKLSDCGVHVFLPWRGYVRLSRKEVERKMILVPGAAAATSVVGENL
jgi:hypothetical protein